MARNGPRGDKERGDTARKRHCSISLGAGAIGTSGVEVCRAPALMQIRCGEIRGSVGCVLQRSKSEIRVWGETGRCPRTARKEIEMNRRSTLQIILVMLVLGLLQLQGQQQGNSTPSAGTTRFPLAAPAGKD